MKYLPKHCALRTKAKEYLLHGKFVDTEGLIVEPKRLWSNVMFSEKGKSIAWNKSSKIVKARFTIERKQIRD